MQRLSAITHMWFGLFRVRSPLLTESRLFSFPVGTEMFHFPTFPPTALCVQAEVAGHYSGFFRGFPIRRSPDRSSFTSSPGLIAGYNVLHRLLVPRHPPCALPILTVIGRIRFARMRTVIPVCWHGCAVFKVREEAPLPGWEVVSQNSTACGPASRARRPPGPVDVSVAVCARRR